MHVNCHLANMDLDPNHGEMNLERVSILQIGDTIDTCP
jgi:hypothetical protein